MILDGVPNEARHGTTFLLVTRDQAWVSWSVEVDVLHRHVARLTKGTALVIVTHEPGGKSHHLLKGDVLEVFN